MGQTVRVLGAALAALILGAPAARAASCESLSDLRLLDTTITSATVVPAGVFPVPGTGPLQTQLQVPAFCRVAGVTTPAVRFEVWLPIEGWNRKLHVVGNDRMGGVINYGGMAGVLGRGYAAASTDTGHIAPRPDSFAAEWAFGRPELVVDFGHRAIHVTAVNAKQIVGAFFERPADYSYFAGCSKGGQQGLMAAQRYPDDFDGIIAGAPTYDWTRFYAGAHLWTAIATLKDEESYIPLDKLPLLDRAVVAACDGLDGVRDGLIGDPRQCTFNPATLVCREGQDVASCFTPKQARAVADIWAGARTSSGAVVFPGLVPGAEASPNSWNPWVVGSAGRFTSTHWYAAEAFFKYMVFDNPAWDFRTFSYDTDVDRALARVGGALDANDPNLRPFKALGGKLLIYHGWSDADITPLSSIDYYERVIPVIGGATRAQALQGTQDFFRLFMAPGMAHCAGGPGPDRFDMLPVLERWVEAGVAPTRITAAHMTNGVVDRTRPLCAYPETPTWDGVGSIDDAASFSCAAPDGTPPR